MTESIVNALEKIHGKGSFYWKTTAKSCDLKVEIHDQKALNFPLTTTQVKKLLSFSHPAMFGWKDKTLLDKKVRDVAEIKKSNVKIDQRQWNKTLKPILNEIQRELGLPLEGSLRAALHNFLLYGPGQFFKPHQDSEKEDGMVATLVVILPCEHTGGKLLIDHNGNKVEIGHDKVSQKDLTFIAFYSNCVHEVQPLKSGHRVALTYNLLFVPDTKKSKEEAAPFPFNLKNLKSELGNYFDHEVHSPDPRKFAFLLDHQYTPLGLSWSLLKGDDYLRARALEEVAKELELEIFLCLADIHEVWSCEEKYGHYRSRRRRYYSDYEEEEDEDQSEDYELTELIEDEIEFKNWLAPQGKASSNKDIRLNQDEIHWIKETSSLEPFNSSYEGWMGNYGNTLERWYHRGAIVLWKKADGFLVALKGDFEGALKTMIKMATKPKNFAESLKLAYSTIPYLSRQFSSNRDNYKSPHTSNSIVLIFKLLTLLKDQDLFHKYLAPMGPYGLTKETFPAFLAFLKASFDGEKNNSIKKLLDTIKGGEPAHQFPEFLTLIEQLLMSPLTGKEALFIWMFDLQLEALKIEDAQRKKNYLPAGVFNDLIDPEEFDSKEIKKYEGILQFLMASLKAQQEKYFELGIDHILKMRPFYSDFEVAKIFKEMKMAHKFSMKGKSLMLLKSVVKELNVQQSIGPQSSSDWSINVSSHCKCKDCNVLHTFLRSKNEQTTALSLAKDRRAHLHHKIELLGIPLTHVTRREGSPHKLVLTKTKDLFVQIEKRFKESKELLKDLGNLYR